MQVGFAEGCAVQFSFLFAQAAPRSRHLVNMSKVCRGKVLKAFLHVTYVRYVSATLSIFIEMVFDTVSVLAKSQVRQRQQRRTAPSSPHTPTLSGKRKVLIG